MRLVSNDTGFEAWSVEMTKPTFSLSHLTLIGCSAPELIYIAERCGYDGVDLRFLPMYIEGEFPCEVSNRDLVLATKTALDNTRVRVYSIELLRIVDHTDVQSFEPAMELAMQLGAKHLIASVWTSDKVSLEKIIEYFIQICDLAKKYNLIVNLEFPTFSSVNTFEKSLAIVERANHPNAGLLIDTIYCEFANEKPKDFKSCDPKWLNFVHVADIPHKLPNSKDEEIVIAREGRLYPGEGRIDFAKLLKNIPCNSYSLEIPNLQSLAKYGCEGHARRCLEASKQVILQDSPVS